MSRILGLDIGSASLGWALLNSGLEQTEGLGVRVFPEGVDRDKKGGELSKNEKRRLVRAHRRQLRRRAERKRRLREALVEAGLYPANLAEQADLDRRDPYELRRRALDENLSPHEIGRVLIHLNQRRGFLSTRKGGGNQEEGQIKEEINALAQRMSAEGDRSLGEYFARRQPPEGEPARTPQADDRRIRRLHTRRDMYRQEFADIWAAQQRHHPDLLTDRLRHGLKGPQKFPVEPDDPQKGKRRQTPLQRYGLEGIIYFQRPTYWPKSAVGACEFEGEKHRRCPRADRLAQKARVYQEVNNLLVIDDDVERPLEPHARQKLIDLLFAYKYRSFDQIRKHLGYLESVRFNLETLAAGGKKTGGRKGLIGLPTDAVMRDTSRFGRKWDQLTEEQKDDAVDALLAFHYGCKTDCGRGDFVDEQQLFARLTRDFGLDAPAAEAVSDSFDDLPPGHGRISRKALKYGKDGTCGIVEALAAGKKMMLGPGEGADDAIHAAGYLRPDERPAKLRTTLPGPGEPGWIELPNPLVRQALHEVRKVVNAVIREHGCPDEIRIELAREVKGSLEKRQQTRYRQFEQEQRRDRAADAIRKAGFRPSREGIQRYLLWEEQAGIGIYSGRPISLSQLFNGEADIDHVLPRSRSLDNSMANKVVDHLDANRKKAQRTPWEWLVRDGEAGYSFDEVLQRARRIPHRGKQRKLAQKQVELDEFTNRQLNDTAYISRAVVQYLKQLGRRVEGEDALQPVRVVGVKGQSTATLRYQWGLNAVLHDTGFESKKNRDDHRHHAVDAAVIALTDQKRLGQLAAGWADVPIVDPDTGEYNLRAAYQGPDLPPPWDNFRDQIEDQINRVRVSHRPQRSVSGPLHEETLYGKSEQPNVFVARKPIESLSPSEIPRIRDIEVRRRIEARLAEHGVDIGRGKGTIPSGVWKEPLWINEAKGIQIKKVRVLKTEESVVPVRGGADNYHDPAGPYLPTKRRGGGAYVKTGKNHHFEIFEIPAAKGKTKYDARNVTMLEAARRKRNRKLIVQTRPDKLGSRFVCSLCPGDSVLITDPDTGHERLMLVSTLVSTQVRIHLVDANDARPSSGENKRKDIGLTPNSMFGKYRACKVELTPLGRIRRAEARRAAEKPAADADIARLAAQRVAGKLSDRAMWKRLKHELNKPHLGAQLTAEIHRLREA